MKHMKDVLYDWMMRNFPSKIMYKNTWIDSQHTMWLPRWGYSKKQIEEARKTADEIFESLKEKNLF